MADKDQKRKFTWEKDDVVWEKEPLAPGEKPVISPEDIPELRRRLNEDDRPRR